MLLILINEWSNPFDNHTAVKRKSITINLCLKTEIYYWSYWVRYLKMWLMIYEWTETFKIVFPSILNKVNGVISSCVQ